MKPSTILLIGCGNMGASLVGGWLDKGIHARSIHIVEPNPSAVVQEYVQKGCILSTTLPDNIYTTDIIILAVKPQTMASALGGLKAFVGPDTMIVSIAAGTTLATLSAAFDSHPLCTRAMPNLPATIGCGITACYAPESVGVVARSTVDDLMSAIGKVVWLESEDQLAAVTALSGSGPAYIFHFIECLENAGVQLGLSAELSRLLALETVAGSSALALGTTVDVSTLRQRVTSPGGTTEAALDVLMPQLGALMRQTLAAAAKRARELAG